MSDLGSSVYEAFSFLDDFLKDVSKLLTTINENLASKHLAPLGDAATFWDHSRAYYAPGQWMPKYIIRHYSNEEYIQKNGSWKVPWLAFFVVYLYPDRFKEPVAGWGYISQKELKDFSGILKKSGLYKQNPNFLTKVSAEEWIDIDDLPDSLLNFKYRSNMLTELHDANIVETMVIQPLMMEVNKYND